MARTHTEAVTVNPCIASATRQDESKLLKAVLSPEHVNESQQVQAASVFTGVGMVYGLSPENWLKQIAHFAVIVAVGGGFSYIFHYRKVIREANKN